MTLVERDGEVRSFHVANVTAKTLRPIIVKVVSRKSYLMTDDAATYIKMGREFSGHGSVNHSADEYVRGDFWHTNTVENYFSILKRGIYGVYHHVSEAHLKRYLVEFDYRYNNRDISDTERMAVQPKPPGGMPKLPYRDDPSIPETFVDSYHQAMFDGNVLRMELTVERYDQLKPPALPTGYAKTAVRLVIPAQLIPELYNNFAKFIAVIAQQGQVVMQGAPPPATPTKQ